MFFWVGHFDCFDFDFFFCFIPMKTCQSLLVSKDGSKFWWLPWFRAKNDPHQKLIPAVYSDIRGIYSLQIPCRLLFGRAIYSFTKIYFIFNSDGSNCLHIYFWFGVYTIGREFEPQIPKPLSKKCEQSKETLNLHLSLIDKRMNHSHKEKPVTLTLQDGRWCWILNHLSLTKITLASWSLKIDSKFSTIYTV